MKKKKAVSFLLLLVFILTLTCKSAPPEVVQVDTSVYDRERNPPDTFALNELEAAAARARAAQQQARDLNSQSHFPMDYQIVTSYFLVSENQVMTATLRETQETTARYYSMAAAFEALNIKTLIMYSTLAGQEESPIMWNTALRHRAEIEQAVAVTESLNEPEYDHVEEIATLETVIEEEEAAEEFAIELAAYIMQQQPRAPAVVTPPVVTSAVVPPPVVTPTVVPPPVVTPTVIPPPVVSPPVVTPPVVTPPVTTPPVDTAPIVRETAPQITTPSVETPIVSETVAAVPATTPSVTTTPVVRETAPATQVTAPSATTTPVVRETASATQVTTPSVTTTPVVRETAPVTQINALSVTTTVVQETAPATPTTPSVDTTPAQVTPESIEETVAEEIADQPASQESASAAEEDTTQTSGQKTNYRIRFFIIFFVCFAVAFCISVLYVRQKRKGK